MSTFLLSDTLYEYYIYEIIEYLQQFCEFFAAFLPVFVHAIVYIDIFHFEQVLIIVYCGNELISREFQIGIFRKLQYAEDCIRWQYASCKLFVGCQSRKSPVKICISKPDCFCRFLPAFPLDNMDDTVYIMWKDYGHKWSLESRHCRR